MKSVAIYPNGTNGVLYEDDDLLLQTFYGGEITLQALGTLFFVVSAGSVVVNGHPMTVGMYGCIPRQASFIGTDCQVMIIDIAPFRGIFALGGPVELIGRLRYINGCTDTGLIHPTKLGDPCLNALFFPARTLQTAHTHPSHRIGLIIDGQGWCMTEHGPLAMRKGDIFFLPAGALHWFKTNDHAMRIAVFHPDSEVGPTDETHQMLQATIIEPAA